MTPEQYFQERWKELRDNAGTEALARVHGAISFAARTGAVTRDQAELWVYRIATCPGHDDEGGRDWCAYCGEMTKEAI